MAGDDSASDRRTKQAEARVGWRMAGLGMEVAAQAAGGALLGWLYDRWRGSGNTGILVGALLGIVVGLWTLIKGGLKLNRQLDDLAAQRRTHGRHRRQPGTSVLSPGPGDAQPDDDSDSDDDWDDWNDDDWGNGNNSNDAGQQ